MTTQENPTQTEEIIFEKIDRKSPEIMEALAHAKIYKKVAKVHARQSIASEIVSTELESGFKETKNTSNEGDWVVTNPGGEEYVIPHNKFSSLYELPGIDGVYKPKGFVRAIPNPFKKPIEITASWGPQTGDENCFIIDSCDDKGESMALSPKLIGGKEFKDTYLLKDLYDYENN